MKQKRSEDQATTTWGSRFDGSVNKRNPFSMLFQKYKNYRDRKFRERIDRVYFRTDGSGRRFISGSLFAVRDEKTGALGHLTACPTDTYDKVVSKLSEFEQK